MKRPLQFFALALLVFLASGCGKLVLRNVEPSPRLDWPQLGGNPQHTSYVATKLLPPLQRHWRHRASSAIGPSLVATQGLVVFGTLDGKIEGVDILKGKKVGRIKIRGNVAGTVAAYKNFLLVARRITQPTLELYDLFRGKSIWKWKGSGIFAEPLIVNDHAYFVDLSGHLIAVSLTEGIKSWSFELEAQSHTTPAYSDGLFVVGDDIGNIYAIDGSGHVVWKFVTGAAVRAAASVAGATVFIGSTDSTFYAIQLADGKLKWSFGVDGKIYRHAAITPRFVLFGATDHKIYCLKRETGDFVWAFEAKSVMGTAPLVVGDVVYIGSLDNKMYALDLTSGEKLWAYKAKGRIRTNPIVVRKRLLFASEDDRLYCFGEE